VVRSIDRLIDQLLQRFSCSGKVGTAAKASGAAGTTAADEQKLVVAGKPFYPEVTISHVETPSMFYVLELAKKQSLDE